MANHIAGNAIDQVGASESQGVKFTRTGFLATGGLLAALGVGSCCVLPVVFMSVGLGGAWMSNLFVLSAYQPLFIALSAGFLGAGFYFAYRKPRTVCTTDGTCDVPTSGRAVKGMLWGAAVLTVVGIVFPYLGQYLLEI